MDELNVRVIQLEPMRMICFSGFGTEPETQAIRKMTEWAKSKGLYKDGKPRRFFGFNNPDPSPGSPNYGYDVWMTVDESVQPDGEARLIEFPGGQYAVARCEVKDPYADIPHTWQRLVTWMENSTYTYGQHQWLEEQLTTYDDPSQGFILDLYLPIK